MPRRSDSLLRGTASSRCVVAGALIVAVASVQVLAAGPVASLCRAGETAYFSCSTPRHKTVSLCGALPSVLRYRYGTPARVELQFPAQASGSASRLRFAHYMRFQTDRSEVTFTHAGSNYAVFDDTERNQRRAGVEVTTPDGREREVRCSGAIHGHLAPLGRALRCDADNALNLGGCH